MAELISSNDRMATKNLSNRRERGWNRKTSGPNKERGFHKRANGLIPIIQGCLISRAFLKCLLEMVAHHNTRVEPRSAYRLSQDSQGTRILDYEGWQIGSRAAFCNLRAPWTLNLSFRFGIDGFKLSSSLFRKFRGVDLTYLPYLHRYCSSHIQGGDITFILIYSVKGGSSLYQKQVAQKRIVAMNFLLHHTL